MTRDCAWPIFRDREEAFGGKGCTWRQRRGASGLTSRRRRVGRIFVRIILLLAQQLQTLVELEAVVDGLYNIEIVGSNGGQDRRRTWVNYCRFSGVEFGAIRRW